MSFGTDMILPLGPFKLGEVPKSVREHGRSVPPNRLLADVYLMTPFVHTTVTPLYTVAITGKLRETRTMDKLTPPRRSPTKVTIRVRAKILNFAADLLDTINPGP